MKNKILPGLLFCTLFLTAALTGQTPGATTSTVAASSAPLQISDIPRNTQMGPGTARYTAPVPTDPSLSTLWLIGDSTVRNGTGGDGTNMNQWGWGAPIVAYFDTKKINVVNRAFGGTSSRSFYNDQWKNMVGLIKKGDIVIMQFGANDNGSPATGKGAIKGNGDETQVVKDETIHTFGWYMNQYIKETVDKGATPIVASLTPRKNWSPDGTRLVGDSASHGGWARQAAKESNAIFVDLNELIARKYGEIGKAKVDLLYVPSPKEGLHTGWDGAVINAECVISGLKALKDDPLAAYFSDRAKTVPAVDASLPFVTAKVAPLPAAPAPPVENPPAGAPAK